MNKDHSYLPILAITMGDPAGIGPEIAVRCFDDPTIYSNCRPILVGHLPTIKQSIQELGVSLHINSIPEPQKASFKPGIIDLIEIGIQYINLIPTSTISVEAGDIAFMCVKKAINLAMAKEVDATVTGPIHKESINLAGHHFSGHTEIYAHYTGTSSYAMLLAHESFRVIHVTTHVSLREACDLVKQPRILETIQLMNNGLKQIGIEDPRIGVAGLNPHSGDGGLFGREEIEEIGPAIVTARNQGIDAEGPIPADTLFAMGYGGKYDGCVAMYHDQGHIPFKVIGFNWDKNNRTMKSVEGVNITLGLPIIRTSVDHGTAFEIAGQGKASPDALKEAIEYAIKLVR